MGTESVSNFSGGAYLNWTISGNVLITITNTGPANAVLSGLFLDPAPPIVDGHRGQLLAQRLDLRPVGDVHGDRQRLGRRRPDGSVEFYDGSTALGPWICPERQRKQRHLDLHHLDVDGGRPFVDHGRLHGDREFCGQRGQYESNGQSQGPDDHGHGREQSL